MSNRPVVIVTGASRGMGAAAVRWLAKAGADIVLTARSEDALKAVAEEAEKLGAQTLSIAADVADPEACERIVSETRKRFGRIDGLINNAGILGPLSPAGSADIGQWRYNIEVNLLAPFYLIRAALPELRKRGGRVVNVSSGAAHKAIEGWSAYCTAKAGLTHMTRVIAAEEPDVTFVALRPGVVDTQMQQQIREEGPGNMTKEKAEYFRELKAEGKLYSPDVPAKIMAWLVLHGTEELNGQFLEHDDPQISSRAKAAFNQ